MPTECTEFHGEYGDETLVSYHASSDIGTSNDTFTFCVFSAFRGPPFRNLGITIDTA
jgi:hypothetical protein